MDWGNVIVGGAGVLLSVISLFLVVRKGRKDDNHKSEDVAAQVDNDIWTRARQELADNYATKQQLAEIKGQVATLMIERQQAIEHVALLESTGHWPTPPGIPSRPAWMRITPTV